MSTLLSNMAVSCRDGSIVGGGLLNDALSEGSIKWKPVSLTHVEYREGDWLGHILAYISLIPVAILAGFVTLIIFRRDLHTMSFFTGMLLNEIINLLLKHIIREYRPCRGHEVVFSEYGMPSSHAQFMWFFAVYIVFFVFIRIHQINNSTIIDNLWKYVATVGIFILALAVSYSRVYLRYHTFSQVFCGAVTGIVLACAWFAVVQIILTPFFPIIVSWPVAEFLMVRDSTLIPNVMWFEYTCHRTESRTRQRKLVSMKSQ